MDTIRMVPVNRVQPSKIDVRGKPDPAAIAELVASIREHGLLQPVLVRPTAGTPGGYEIVAGRQRLAAVKEVGLKEIPAVIRDLDDAHALEVQVVENLQRRDIHELDEAEGLRLLHVEHGYRVEDLAIKLGKSVGYVYGRLKLCELPKAAAEACRGEKISPSTAQLIGRIPNEQLREKATAAILKGTWRGDALTYREAKDLIEREYMTALKGAPFKADDAELVPAAGPCSTCPKRSGNQPELFGEARSKKDVCLDPVCFAAKAEAGWQQAADAQAKKDGVKVLTAKQSERAFQFGREVSHTYVRPGSVCRRDPDGRRYNQLLKGEHAPTVYVARDPDGKPVKLLKRSEVEKALEAAGHTFAGGSTSRTSRATPKPKEGLRNDAVADEVYPRTAELVVESVRRAGGLTRDVLLLAVGQASMMEGADRALGRRGIRRAGIDSLDINERELKDLDDLELAGLFAELLWSEQFETAKWGAGKSLEDATRLLFRFGGNLAQIEKDAVATVAARREEEAKAEREKKAAARASKKATKKKRSTKKTKAASKKKVVRKKKATKVRDGKAAAAGAS